MTAATCPSMPMGHSFCPRPHLRACADRECAKLRSQGNAPPAETEREAGRAWRSPSRRSSRRQIRRCGATIPFSTAHPPAWPAHPSAIALFLRFLALVLSLSISPFLSGPGDCSYLCSASSTVPPTVSPPPLTRRDSVAGVAWLTDCFVPPSAHVQTEVRNFGVSRQRPISRDGA